MTTSKEHMPIAKGHTPADLENEREHFHDHPIPG
jgi:hypothetical protein